MVGDGGVDVPSSAQVVEVVDQLAGSVALLASATSRQQAVELVLRPRTPLCADHASGRAQLGEERLEVGGDREARHQVGEPGGGVVGGSVTATVVVGAIVVDSLLAVAGVVSAASLRRDGAAIRRRDEVASRWLVTGGDRDAGEPDEAEGTEDDERARATGRTRRDAASPG